MKNYIRLSFILIICNVLFSYNALCQVPGYFNYQAVIRDANNQALTNQEVALRISILESAESEAVFSEIHKLTTSPTGMITVLVGDGTILTGSLSSLDWSSVHYHLKVEVDPENGTNFTSLGTTPLVSVPYAIQAGNVDMPLKKLEVMETANQSADESLFEVKRSDGSTVFAVYNEGVRVYVDEQNAKGVKGGFAVGGYNTGKGYTNEYLRVTPDSVRIYVDEIAGKGVKGGFAVGGYNTGKRNSEEYLRVTPDSVRIYIKESQEKGIKGGFAVGGYNTGKSGATQYLQLTPQNYFIGHQAGTNNEGGLYNIFLGYNSGHNNIGGDKNLFLGYNSGYSNTEGFQNIFLGDSTGLKNEIGWHNVFIGSFAGRDNVSGSKNIAIGTMAGRGLETGWNNLFLGELAGGANTVGSSNIFLGNYAGRRNTEGETNIFIGQSSGYYNTTGANNIFMGMFSGNSNTFGTENIFIGKESGYSNTVGNLNTLIGFQSGYSQDSANYNTFLGFWSGYYNKSGSLNTFIGAHAGHNSINGELNTVVGAYAGSEKDMGTENTFIGMGAGNKNEGNNNTFLGAQAANGNETGSDNTIIGFYSGEKSTGSSNVFIGNNAGRYCEGDNNIMIGNGAGFQNKQSNRLFIDGWFGADSSQALIYGETDNRILRFNGPIGINTHPMDNAELSVYDPVSSGKILVKGPGDAYNYARIHLVSEGQDVEKAYIMAHTLSNGFILNYHDGVSNYVRLHLSESGNLSINSSEEGTETLDVAGNARFRAVGSAASANDLRITAEGTLTTSTSDARLKTDLSSIDQALSKVLQMRGYEFSWTEDVNGKRDVGLIAQELNKVFPEAVFENPTDGYLGINYSRLPVLLIEAIKEQQVIIDSKQSQINKLEDRLARLEKIIGLE